MITTDKIFHFVQGNYRDFFIIDTRVRDKFSMKIVLTALIFLHIQAVLPAYSQRNNMQ